jgi:hypothetical protein
MFTLYTYCRQWHETQLLTEFFLRKVDIGIILQECNIERNRLIFRRQITHSKIEVSKCDGFEINHFKIIYCVMVYCS